MSSRYNALLDLAAAPTPLAHYTVIGAGEYADDFNDVAHPLRANNYPPVEATTDGDLSVHASVLAFLADLDTDSDGYFDGDSVWIGGCRYIVQKGGI